MKEALEHRDDPPSNESSTCEWVILPLLYDIGYARREVLPHSQDGSGKFPDYTLLPSDSEHVFYLEAKAWGIDLEDSHAVQALNYANHNGKRWVVLTNGRVWRLYDNDIRARPEGKLVAEARLEEQEIMARFLDGISKQSVCSDGLERFAVEESARRKEEAEAKARALAEQDRRRQLGEILGRSLKDGSSTITGVLVECLKQLPGLGSVTAEDVVVYFGGMPVALPRSQPTYPPVGSTDEVLVVAATDAWPEYQKVSAYICQPNRSFRLVSHMAFYHDGAIERSVPRILESVEDIELSEQSIKTGNALSESQRTRLASLIGDLTGKGLKERIGQRCKVMFLSSEHSAETISLPQRIENDIRTERGRPWPFVVGQRYVSFKRLTSGPTKTSELQEEE